MTKQRTENKTIDFKPSIRDVFVCKKNSLKPFLEIFIQEPENISQQSLGTLMGIFEITDHSEDSSYIVNYLISVIKKEYFSRTNRGVIESFEAALHKANLALSKLASHENVGWIGNLNAVCAVVKKNNLHIAQTGNAVALLVRNKALTELTENPEAILEDNPLKTFQDVLSGRTEIGDKIILTTSSLFEIFSQDEIKRSALKFSSPDFLRFLNTALINELEQASVIVIDTEEEKKKIVAKETTKHPLKINAFSEKAFRKEMSGQYIDSDNKKDPQIAILEREEDSKIKEEIEKSKNDFTDKRTGHIYIKEEEVLEEKTEVAEKLPNIFSEIGEKSSALLKKTAASFGSLLFIFIKKSGSWVVLLIKKTYAKTEESISNIRKRIVEEYRKKRYSTPTENDLKKIEVRLEERIEENRENKNIEETHIENEKVIIVKEYFWKKIDYIILWEKISRFSSEKFNLLVSYSKKIGIIILIFFGNTKKYFLNFYSWLKNKWLTIKEEFQSRKKYESIALESRPLEKLADISLFAPNAEQIPINVTVEKNESEPVDFISIIKNILPNFSKIKTIAQKLEKKQKIYVILLMIAILIIPYWISKWSGEEKEKSAPTENIAPFTKNPLPLENDKNISRIDAPSQILSIPYSSEIINLKGAIFAITKEKIIDINSRMEYAIPEEFKNPELSTAMNDLNLIFLLKNKRIISFSPVSKKFIAASIAIPTEADIRGIGTYMTYLYVIDSKNNQVYRYPRSDASGGFGEKNDWLKDRADLSRISGMTINDGIFIIDSGKISRFFKNKKQDFSIEATATPIIPEKIFTLENSTNLYILDKNNSRIIKIDANGNIVKQYHNSELSKTESFAVNEENNTIYFSTNNSVTSFNMN